MSLFKKLLGMRTLILFALIVLCACSEEEQPRLITTSPVTKITAYSAESGGSNLIVGFLDEAGVVWADHRSPTLQDYKIMSVDTPKDFVANLCDLRSNTTYYIRSYIMNKGITVYGNELVFKTK